MSLPSKRYKQEIKVVIILLTNTASHSLQLPLKDNSLRIFFKIVFPALPQNVLLQCNTCSVFK